MIKHTEIGLLDKESGSMILIKIGYYTKAYFFRFSIAIGGVL